MSDHDEASDYVMKWYVVKVQSNREKSIRDSIQRRVKRDGLDSCFGEIVIAVERVVDSKSGKKRISEQKLFPGYLMVQMCLTEESWFLVRSVSGVGDFTGTSGVASQYVNAPAIATLPVTAQIVSVRIWLLVRSDTQERGFVDTRTYFYGNRTAGTTTSLAIVADANKGYRPADTFRRLLVSRTIMIRNALGT